jgi:hypothetical protein
VDSAHLAPSARGALGIKLFSRTPLLVHPLARGPRACHGLDIR